MTTSESLHENEASLEKAHAVTGAFGFSGRFIARRLLDAGKRVVTLTGSPDRPNPFANKVEARPFDFHNVQAMSESLRDVEVLYNTYWVRFNHNLFSHSKAVRNTLALFEAAKSAGVKRIVHVSITNADTASPFEYFSAKGHLEKALQAMYGDSTGRSYAVVRPAVLFGPGDILINNIAWALRRFPFFFLFGDGSYHIQPIHVDDMAAIMVEQGEKADNVVMNALGPEDFTYRDLVTMLGKAIGKERRLVEMRPDLAYRAASLIGMLIGDTFITREEIAGLMANTLHVSGADPTGTTRLSEWVVREAKNLGTVYHSELDRRVERNKPYKGMSTKKLDM